MNAKDRKVLSDALDNLRGIEGIISQLADAEQEKFDNMTEGLQQNEKGQAIEAAAQALSDAQASLEAVISELEDYA